MLYRGFETHKKNLWQDQMHCHRWPLVSSTQAAGWQWQPGVTATVDLLLSQTCFCKAWDTEQQVGLPKAARLKNTQRWVLTVAGGGLACPPGHRSFGRSSLGTSVCLLCQVSSLRYLIERLSAIMGSKWKPRILLKRLSKAYFSFYKWANIFECESGIKRLLME